MENYLEYFWKVNALLALFFGCYFLFLKKETYFTYNRYFLLTGLFAAVTIPFISFTKTIIVAPIKQIISQSISTTTNIKTAQIAQQTEQAFNWTSFFVICYLSIVFIFMLKILIEYYFYKKALHNQQFIHKNNFRLFEINSKIEPFSFFKTIVYNPNLHSKTELAFILAHEKVHAKQFHSIDVLISKVFSAVFWYNPIIWFYKKAIIQNLEFIADAGAILQVIDKKQYQYTLLKNTTNISCVAITNHFYQSLIKKRIVMLNKKPSHRANLIKLAIVVPVLAIFIFQFQTKIVAQEKLEIITKSSSKPDKKIEPILITKNSTDAFFKETTTKLKSENNIDIEFSKIKRNSKKEITKIKIKFDDHKGTQSEHEVDSTEPINDFTIVYNNDASGSSEVGFYSKKYANGNEVSLTASNYNPKSDSISNSDNYAIEMPSPPSPPTPPNPPTPPSPPKHGYSASQPKFNAPKPPKAPRNMQDPKVAADFELKMREFEKQMDIASDKFDNEMQKFSTIEDEKMAEFDKQMNEFDKKMNEYDQKMNEYNDKMEAYSEGTSIQKAQDIEKRTGDVRRRREIIIEKRQQIQSR